MHARTIGVEDAGDLDLKAVLAMIIEKEGLRTTLPLIVTSTRPNRVHASTVGLGLGMYCGVAVYFGSGGLKNFCFQTLGQTKYVDGPVNIDLGGLHWVVLIVNGRCRTCKVVDIIYFHI